MLGTLHLHVQGPTLGDGGVEQIEGGDQGMRATPFQNAYERSAAAIDPDIRTIGAGVDTGGAGLQVVIV